MRLFPRTARRRLAAAAAAGALAIGAVTVPLANADDLHDREKNVQKQIKHADHDLDESSHRFRQATARLEAAQADLDAGQGRARRRLSGKLAAARVRDHEMQVKLAEAEARLAQAETDLVERPQATRRPARGRGRHGQLDLPGRQHRPDGRGVVPQRAVDRGSDPAGRDAGRHGRQADVRVRRAAAPPRSCSRSASSRSRTPRTRWRSSAAQPPSTWSSMQELHASALAARARVRETGPGAARRAPAGAAGPPPRPAAARAAAPGGAPDQAADHRPGRSKSATAATTERPAAS